VEGVEGKTQTLKSYMTLSLLCVFLVCVLPSTPSTL
jgi:hypothetical protein